MAVEEKELTLKMVEQKALEVERLEAALKHLKDELKQWVNENGPLVAGEKVWDYSEAVSWKFDPDQLKELSRVMVLEGDDPWRHLTIPATSIKKLKWDEAFLSQYGEMKVTRKFSSKKVVQ